MSADILIYQLLLMVLGKSMGIRHCMVVVIATSVYTGKVLDASILSRFCKSPNKMNNENCKTNHFENSGSMEVSGAIEIFQRSESLHGLRYTKFLGDGDSRAVKEIQPVEIQILKNWNVFS
ncbi:hypothetical protein TNCV_4431161 [Trichonephila clavipes]|nr:hypothetical protein TNCV_4431161 [Trichonephila clavipes]